MLIFIKIVKNTNYLFENLQPVGLAGTLDPRDDPFAMPGRNNLGVKEDLAALRANVGGYGARYGLRSKM